MDWVNEWMNVWIDGLMKEWMEIMNEIDTHVTYLYMKQWNVDTITNNSNSKTTMRTNGDEKTIDRLKNK